MSGVITLIRFQSLVDCDGIEGDGDFIFDASVSATNGVRLTNPGVRTGEQILGDGEYHNVLWDVPFEMDDPEGQSFTVTFDAQERDTDIFGNVWVDDRILGSTQRVHSFAGGAWSNLSPSSTGLGGTYPNAIQIVNGSVGSNCAAELHYVVSFNS